MTISFRKLVYVVCFADADACYILSIHDHTYTFQNMISVFFKSGLPKKPLAHGGNCPPCRRRRCRSSRGSFWRKTWPYASGWDIFHIVMVIYTNRINSWSIIMKRCITHRCYHYHNHHHHLHQHHQLHQCSPGTAIGVSLHEGVVAGGSPLVPLGEDTVAFVMYTHCVHLQWSCHDPFLRLLVHVIIKVTDKPLYRFPLPDLEDPSSSCNGHSTPPFKLAWVKHSTQIIYNQ